MYSTKIDPKFNKKQNPKIGLIALASDYMIEKDFISVIKDKKIDFFVNRIESYNPLTSENLIKMSEKVTEVTKDILPNEKIDCSMFININSYENDNLYISEAELKYGPSEKYVINQIEYFNLDKDYFENIRQQLNVEPLTFEDLYKIFE